MKKFKLNHLSLMIITCLPLMVKAGVEPDSQSPQIQALASQTQLDDQALELMLSESTELKQTIHEQSDNSRIYLDEGAIWASRDITKVDPVLELSVSDAIEVEQGKISDKVSFNLVTNYSYYIKRWQLEVYRGKDIHLSEPLKVLTGETLSNEFDLQWDGVTDIPYEMKKGQQLLFRLKLWDKDGNMDVTSIGVTDLIRASQGVEMEKFDHQQVNAGDNTGDNDPDKGSRSYGVAKLLRHNIPTSAGMAKLMGTGLKGVDRVFIGEDEYAIEDNRLYVEQYLPADAYMFPVKVKYDDGHERNYQLFVRIPDTYYAQTALADLYIGKNRVSGNKEVLGVDDQYQGDIYNRGRLAYFGEGKFGDKLRVVAHVDTKDQTLKDMFKNPFAADTTTVFDILDDDELYYGNYGDNANIQKVVNTKGKVYLDLQYDKSNVMWGNYNTGISGTENAQYNRSLYGFRGNYRTRSTTEFGDDRLNLVGFASQADSLYSHDEFRSTGLSLYFLRHGEVLPGSDKVVVRQMDDRNNRIVNEVILQEGRDYEFDAYQGRILLTRPLSAIAGDSFGSVISDTPSGDLKNYLVVDYEYIPRGSEALDKMAMGGRAKGWVNDHIGIGASYVQEEKENQDYQLSSADLTLKLTEGSFLKAEFSHSEGTQADSNFVSDDGGLTFEEISRVGQTREGDAISISGVANLYDVMPEIFGAVGNDLSVWYKDKDAGYSYASQSDDLAQVSLGTELRLQTGEDSQLLASFQTIEEIELTGKKVTDTQDVKLEAQVMLTDHIKVGIAGQQIQELNQNDEKSDGSLLGARLEYVFDDSNNVYIKAQKTIESSDSFDQNDSASIGGEAKITQDLSLLGEYTTGDRGDSAQATINYDINDEHSTYVTLVQDDYEDSNNIIIGQRASLTTNLDGYLENKFVDENNGKGRIDSTGLDYDVNQDIRAGIGYQQGYIDYRDEADVKRTGYTVYIDFNRDNYQLGTKFEYRIDKGEEEIEQYVTTNHYTHHLTDEYTLYAKVNYSRTKNKTTKEQVAKFIESYVGLAYRPVYNDKLNFLSRYTYLVDFDSLDRDISYTDEESHIIEAEGIYSLNAKIDLGAKFAYKHKLEQFERESGELFPTESDIYLTGLSASYSVMKDWNVTGEYHWKQMIP
ncbi:hypothetical protein Sps_03379 [Shewanella psychrophila]|uniref:Uncharacterized protein n=1 Tax=Shewanella psychrophila TaxID=225848 RepID=A0A1S6HSL6_9GAMM|nr:hypothetical protein [Shewanella psychrophila]AQS38509.1 hypothetical protein Sps_03379 [Shewanella psychrophila]